MTLWAFVEADVSLLLLRFSTLLQDTEDYALCAYVTIIKQNIEI